MSPLAGNTPSAAFAGDPSGNQSFFLPGRPVGCLLLHGFSAAPQEVRFLGDELALRGYTVSGARLSGHGTSLSEFAKATRHDWYASARDALLDLRNRSDKVVVVGQSMGALLALQLAAERPQDVAAVGLLTPAIRLRARWQHWLRPWLRWLGGPHRFISKGESDIADPQARAERCCYSKIPLSALAELLQLQRDVRPQIARVHQPVLIIHSRQDHTCSLTGVEILKRALPTKPQVLILEKSYHVLSVDCERERVASTVAAFVGAAMRDIGS